MSIRFAIRPILAASALALVAATGLVLPARAVSTTQSTVMADAGAPSLIVAHVRSGHTLCGDRLGQIPSAQTLQSCRTRHFDAMQVQLAALKSGAH